MNLSSAFMEVLPGKDGLNHFVKRSDTLNAADVEALRDLIVLLHATPQAKIREIHGRSLHGAIKLGILQPRMDAKERE